MHIFNNLNHWYPLFRQLTQLMKKRSSQRNDQTKAKCEKNVGLSATEKNQLPWKIAWSPEIRKVLGSGKICSHGIKVKKESKQVYSYTFKLARAELTAIAARKLFRG